MTGYQKRMHEWAAMKRRGWEKSREIVKKFLEDSEASEEVMKAFEMLARPPTYVWA